MAGSTRGRRRLIEKYRLTFHLSLVRMTRGARNILVSTFQREDRLLMVKERRPPFLRVVAGRAIIHLLPELVAMRILVTIRTTRRGLCKLHMHHRLFQVGWAMTIHTGHRPVGAL